MEENLNTVDAVQEDVVDSQPQEQVESTTESVNEEVATSQKQEKPVQTAEDNARYAEIRRKAESEAVDRYIASQGYEYNGKPITTKAEYDRALAEVEEQQRRAALQEQGIDPSIVDEYVNNNPVVKWANEFKTQQEQQQAKQADFSDFLSAYPDVKPEEIAAEVWEANSKGVPLRIAYAAHQENATLKAKLAEYEKGAKTNEVNAKNAENSTGSVTGNGSTGQPFYTREQVQAMSQEEVNKNYKTIVESMKSWK